DGWRSFSRSQILKNTGVRMITNAGVSDCSHTAGKVYQPICVLTSLSAKRFRLAPFCSYAAQKRIVNTKRIKIATMRFQSSLVKGGAGGVVVSVLRDRGILFPTRASVLPFSA